MVIILTLVLCIAVSAQRYEERIVFASYEDGDGELFLVEGKDGEPVQLTRNHVYDGQPALSPDGGRVAFVSSASGELEIHLFDIKSRVSEQLAKAMPGSRYGHPDWSPDGKYIACVYEGDIYIMDGAGENLTRLTEIGSASHPQWSPDEKSIVFIHQKNQNKLDQIALLDIETGQVRNLTDPGAFDSPIWSPDGRQIAFATYVNPASLYHIYVMDANGRNVKQLTDLPAIYSDPVWSPDGRKIAFARMTDSHSPSEVYVMDADGNNVRNITNSPESEEQPDWSPDGKKLVFASTEILLQTIFIMDADGKNRRKLIEESGVYTSPDWLSDGRIAFASLEDGGVYAVDADDGEPELVMGNPGKLEMMFPVWSSDGKKVAYETIERDAAGNIVSIRLCMSDSDGRNERLIMDLNSPAKGRFSWSPDGRKITISLGTEQDSGLVHIVDVASGDTVRLGDADTFVHQSAPSFSPDGRKIAFIGKEKSAYGQWIHVMNAGGSNPQAIGPVEPIRREMEMTWSPDGSQVLFSGRNKDDVRLICRMDMQTGQSERWYENADAPDWIDPRSFFSINPRSKLLTSWGKIRQAPAE